MTLTGIRDSFIQRMVSNWAHIDVPMFYDNSTKPDLDSLEHFGKFGVEFLDSKQIDMAITPNTRVYGTIAIILFSKEGTGTRHDTLLMDELTETFKLGSMVAIHTQPPRPGRSEAHEGWRSVSLLVSFFADSNA